jgi:hypothetical protein
MSPRALPLVLLLAASAPAQVPYGHFVVSAKQTAAGNDPTGAWFVDPATGDVTEVLGLTTGSPRLTDLLTLSIDPANQDLIVKNDLLQGFTLSVYRLPLQGRVAQTRANIGYATNGKVTDLLVHPTGNLLMVFGGNGANAGLWSGPLAGGANVALGRAIDAVKVAADAQAAYLLTQSVGSSDVWRYDFATQGFTRVGAGLPESAAIEVFPAAPLLLVGTVSGDLLRFDASSGQHTVFRSVNRGPITGLRYNVRTAQLLGVTSTGSVFNLSGNEVASIPRALADIDTGTSDAAAFFTFGDACQGMAARPPLMGAAGLPTLGNAAFRMTVAQATPSSVAIHALGNSRRGWFSLPLPIDLTAIGAPGCSVYVNGVFLSAVPLSGAGAGSLPLPVPNDAALKGAAPVAQWWVADPGANAFGFLFSEGGEAVIR